MPGPTPEYWPFEFPPAGGRTALQRQLHEFLEATRLDGFRPCRFADGEYRVETADRSGWLLYRGRVGAGSRWEVWLNDAAIRVASVRTDGFDAAAAAVLGWVRGGPVPVPTATAPLAAVAPTA